MTDWGDDRGQRDDAVLPGHRPRFDGRNHRFSHGLLWGTELFAAQIAALRGRYRCIAWITAGRGRARRIRDRRCIDMELVWKDAVALLETLGTGAVPSAALDGRVRRACGWRPRPPGSRPFTDPARTSSDPSHGRKNLTKYRLMIRVVRLLGPRVVRGQIAPIMLGRIDSH